MGFSYQIERIIATFKEYRENVCRLETLDISFDPEISNRSISKSIREEVLYSLVGNDFFMESDWQDNAAFMIASEMGVPMERVVIK